MGEWVTLDPRPDAIAYPDSIETAPPWELAALRPGGRVLLIGERDGRRMREWFTVLGRAGDAYAVRTSPGEVTEVPLAYVVSVDPEPHLGAVVDGELALLTAAVRADPVAVDALLHPDYAEFGRSGQAYDKAAILHDIAGATGDIEARGILVEEIAPGVVLVTYRSLRDAGATNRSSVWVRGDDGRWLLRHHQGTDAY